ncbi:TonB-dependent receptor [Novosphingobium sp.]|uniref:TonB-dependent receptor n=1 Tax=Novosphingobium sp. TaxID=1874826 RepID=UPI003D0A0A1B
MTKHATALAATSGLFALAMGLTTPAHAEDKPATPDAVAPGEIIVTATRRAEVLSKVPVSITAFGQASLDVRGIKDIAGVVRETPGIQFDPNGFGNQTNIAIRGVSSTVGAATTGIYIDDTPIQSRSVGYSTTNAFPAVFDLSRVEVLRGPQGTLFGAGSEGGTVRFITTQPSLDAVHIYARAEASATQGGAASGEFGVSITAPLIPGKLGFAASLWDRHDGGWVDRVNANPALTDQIVQRNVNFSDTQVGRVALKWVPAEGLTITPSLFYQRKLINDSSNYWETLSSPSQGRFPTGRFLSGQPNAAPDHDRFLLPALNIAYDFTGVQLINNTSYYIRDQSAQIDYSTLWPAVFDGTPFGSPRYNALAHLANNQRTFTEEVRLQSSDREARLSWVLGAFYAKSVQHFSEAVADPYFADLFGGVPPQFIFGTPLVDGLYSLQGSGRGADEQIAGFGEATFAFTPTLKATAGLRVTHTKFDGNSLFQGPVSGYQLQSPQSVRETPVTPKFALNWQSSPALLLYATASKGYRIGGTNAPVPLSVCGADLTGYGFSNVPATYQSDSLWSYEAGAKGHLGHAVTIAASAFRVDWKNIQQNVYLQHCGAQFTANLGKARSEGFDVSATVRPATGLSIDGTVSYTNAHFTQDVGGGALATNADHLETHPWTATVGGDYTTPVGAGSAYLRGDYQYKSTGAETTMTDPATNSYDPGAIRTQALHYASARVGWRHDVFDLSLFVDNVGNTHPILSRSINVVGVGSYQDITLRPRTFGMTLLLRQ